MGGSSGGTQVYNPSPAPAPTPAQSAADYAAALPAIYKAQLEYQPQFDAQQLASAQNLSPAYTKLYNDINKQLYPETYGLQEQLAKIASEGSMGQIPSWMKNQYQSDLSAQLGTNANAGIGADYVSRGLLDQQQRYNQYYQNLGLSVAGRQPLTNPQTAQQPSTFDVASQFAPNYQNQMQGYGSFISGGRPITTQGGQPNWIAGLQAGGSVLQGLGSLGAMFP